MWADDTRQYYYTVVLLDDTGNVLNATGLCTLKRLMKKFLHYVCLIHSFVCVCIYAYIHVHVCVCIFLYIHMLWIKLHYLQKPGAKNEILIYSAWLCVPERSGWPTARAVLAKPW